MTGSGLEGVWDSASVRGGNCRWQAFQAVPQVAALLPQGLMVFCVSLREDLLAVYGLDDSLRPDTKPVVSELQNRDVAVSLISGDDHKDWPPTRNPRSPNQIKVLPWRQAEVCQKDHGSQR